MWFCNSDLFRVYSFTVDKLLLIVQLPLSKSHPKKPHLRCFCTYSILYKGMPIPWISLHRWMFDSLYPFISLPPQYNCCSLVPYFILSPLCLLPSTVSSLSTLFHDHLFSQLIHSWGAMVLRLPQRSTDPGFLGLKRRIY